MFPIYDFHHQFQGPKQTSQVTNYIPDIPEIIHNELFRIILNYSKLFLGSWWGSLQCSAQFSQKTFYARIYRKKGKLDWTPWSSIGLYPYRENPPVWTHTVWGSARQIKAIMWCWNGATVKGKPSDEVSIDGKAHLLIYHLRDRIWGIIPRCSLNQF